MFSVFLVWKREVIILLILLLYMLKLKCSLDSRATAVHPVFLDPRPFIFTQESFSLLRFHTRINDMFGEADDRLRAIFTTSYQWYSLSTEPPCMMLTLNTGLRERLIMFSTVKSCHFPYDVLEGSQCVWPILKEWGMTCGSPP
jgi:hypothetical protein